MPNQLTAVDAAFRALADPTRRAVVQRLCLGPATVTELAAPFEMALPSFLQHLRVLETGGLLTTVKRGRTRTCVLRPESLASVTDWLAERRAAWESHADRLEAHVLDLQSKEPTA